MKYVVEFNPHLDPTQVEVEADSLGEAVEEAWRQAHVHSEVIDQELEPSYRAEPGGQPWQRIIINVLPGGWVTDDDD